MLAAALLLGCGESDPPTQTPDDVATADLPSQPDDDVVTQAGPVAAYLQITDDTEAVMSLSCEETSSAGADIDGAQLFAGPKELAAGTPMATLASCRWLDKGGACAANMFDQPREAEGKLDAEAVSGFVSLNGGSILCEWSGGAKMGLGMVVRVAEVSAPNETEPHKLRACRDRDATDCGDYQTTTRAQETHAAGNLL